MTSMSDDYRDTELSEKLERQTNRANNEERIRQDYVERFIALEKKLKETQAKHADLIKRLEEG